MSRPLRTARRPPSHVSTSWARRLTRFTSNFPRLLRTDYWKPSRAHGLWSSLFARQKSSKGRRTRKASYVRVESLEERRLLTAAITYVNDNWNLVTDNGTHGVLDAGDIVNNVNDAGAPLVVATIGTDAFGTVTTTSTMGDPTGAIPGASKINNAIAGTDVGGTVNLLQGTYIETVTISKSLTLTGAGQAGPGATTIIPDVSGVGGASGTLSGTTMILINADNVTVQNVTVDGDNPGPTSGRCSTCQRGDRHRDQLRSSNASYSGMTVKNVTVQEHLLARH